ncbi:MAG: Spy/CpxP family protein refolding chaperone [Methylococcaceae bacterium]|nr:Spy/CpxP family protein refolding chaperone [Methylococcaceae bacterium]
MRLFLNDRGIHMKQRSRFPAMVLIALSAVASGVLLAEQAPITTGDSVEQSGKRCRSESSRAERLEKNLQTLHSDLKLRATQDAAWNEWSDKITRSHSGRNERCQEFESWSKLPVIDRMEKKLAFFKERQNKLEEGISATKAFYGLLSPQQRQVFDQQFNFWPHGKGRTEPQEALPERPE